MNSTAFGPVSNMNNSGYSDDQLMDEAQQRFEKKNGKPFTLVHWWKILKNEPKWRAHVGQSEKEKNKNIHVDSVDDKEEHPTGRESAKTAQREAEGGTSYGWHCPPWR